MPFETPPRRGGVLENLLAQFGVRQTPGSAPEASTQARRQSSLGSPQTPLTVAVEAAAPTRNNQPNLRLPNTNLEPSDISQTTFVSLSDPSSSTDYTSESDSESASEGLENSSTPNPRASLRTARRSYAQLEGLKMENRRKDRDENVRRSTRKRKSDILASDTVYFLPTPPSKRKSAAPSPRKLDTTRTRLRDEIARKTQAKANAFMVAHKELLLPLLPAQNYVARLIANEQLPSVVPFKLLPQQPKGVKATMKPYQLEGLSFLAYLHNNGFSGILADEMGLGKTLQTLSLFQYLEERDRELGVVSEESRPYLVVCPLSVLNSWVNEARKVTELPCACWKILLTFALVGT